MAYLTYKIKNAQVSSFQIVAAAEEDAFEFKSDGGEEIDAQEWSLVYETIQRSPAVREVVPEGFVQTFPPHIVVDPEPASAADDDGPTVGSSTWSDGDFDANGLF